MSQFRKHLKAEEGLNRRRGITSIGAAFERFDDFLKEVHGLGHAKIAPLRVLCHHPMERVQKC